MGTAQQVAVRAPRRSRAAISVAAVLLLAVGIAACGDDSDDPESTESDGTTAVEETSSGDALAEAEAAVAAAYEGTGREPAPGPAGVGGKNVYVVSCGSVVIGCQVPAEEVVNAGEVLGWEVTVVDGQANPAGYSAAISQAVAAGADGIITVGIDCVVATSAYQEAAAANIPTVGVYNLECEATDSGENLLAAVMDAGTGQDSGQWFYEWGKLKAQYAIANTGGNARILEINLEGFNSLQYLQRGTNETLAQCEGCTVVDTVTLAPGDLFDGTAQTKIASAFVANAGEIDTVLFDSDTSLTAGVAALRSGADPNWLVVGNEGLPTTMSLVGTEVDALITMPTRWLGWCGAYTLNELFADHAVTDCGIGFSIADSEHNTPKDGQEFGTTSIDYEELMSEQWNS